MIFQPNDRQNNDHENNDHENNDHENNDRENNDRENTACESGGNFLRLSLTADLSEVFRLTHALLSLVRATTHSNLGESWI